MKMKVAGKLDATVQSVCLIIVEGGALSAFLRQFSVTSERGGRMFTRI